MSQTADGEFVARSEPFRRELLAHCYRMLGAVDEAEDLVQETYLRAWRSFGGFEDRSSLRVWLYRIATNACLTALEGRGRRALPSGLDDPSSDPTATPTVAGPEVSWLQPIPDSLVSPDSADPAAIVAARDSIRLALIATLQLLPARQRAVLILREVLAFPAAEVAAMLDTTTAAVKSALQRARATLEAADLTPDNVSEPTEPERRALLDLYMAGFQNADVTLLEQALRKDATLEMIPARTWFAGIETCVPYMARFLGSPGDWWMVPTAANGEPAAVAYLRGDDGEYHAFGVAVLSTTTAGIAGIVVFGGADVVARFGFPALRPGGRS